MLSSAQSNILRRQLRNASPRCMYQCQQKITRAASNAAASRNASSDPRTFHQQDLEFAMANVRHYDPAGVLPGRLLYSDKLMQTSYFAVRSFWVETGLRHGAATARGVKQPNATPAEHLDWWQQGIDKVVFSSNETSDIDDYSQFSTHPTLRLLRHLIQEKGVSSWTKDSFDSILEGRRKDLDVKQYETMEQLIQHAEQSCGNLTKLVIQSHYPMETAESHPESLYEAARLVGITHGLTNALRTSIPVISSTGKLVIPAELTQKHGVQSPRYLLSALGQGHDETCVRALQACVQDIAQVARDHLQQARDLRPKVLEETDNNNRTLTAVLLPGVASETFLDRLERSEYQLTDSNLRHVGMVEHATCAARMISAFYQCTY